MNFGHRNHAEDDEDEVERPGIYDMKMSLFSKHHPQSHRPTLHSNPHYSDSPIHSIQIFFLSQYIQSSSKERRIPFQNVQPNHLRFCPCPLSARNPNSPSALLLEYHQAAMFMRSWHLPG